MFRIFASIRAKLIGAFVAMLTLICCLGGVSFWGATQLASTTENFAFRLLPGVSAATTLRGDIFNTRVSVLSFLAAQTAEDRQQQQALFDERSAIVSKDIADFQTSFVSSGDQEGALIAELQTTWSSYLDEVPAIFELAASGQEAQAYAQNNRQLKPLAVQTADLAEQLADDKKSDATAASTASSALTNGIKTALIAGVVLALVATLSFAVAIITTIGKGIDAMVRPMSALATGDLSVEIPMRGQRTELGKIADAVEVFKQNMIQGEALEKEKIIGQQQIEGNAKMMAALQTEIAGVVTAGIQGNFNKRITTSFDDRELNALATGVNELVQTVETGLGETSAVLASIAKAELTERVTGHYAGAFGKLKSDTNAVADRLTEIVTQLRGTSRTLKTATGEILSGANDLSERTTKQAAAIEETSAAVEQIAQTVKANAAQAEQATEKTAAAAMVADEGGRVMMEATHAMERITASSAKISNIINMIDDIAFQTNLLALNASVEAARAGDAGKGFAVVAVEVRRLAQSAASASSDIKNLIEESTKEVNGGSRLVGEASQTLVNIMHAVQENSVLMKSIASASREQSSSIQEVTTAIRQMDEMTQHNAALVEETNAAIEQTESQANDLDRIVDIFKLTAPRQGQITEAAARPGSIKSMQQKLTGASKAYLRRGNAALASDPDWSEF